MKLDSKTAIIVAASTAIGFVGDVVTYSLGESKGKPFKIVVPKGMELAKLLALGIVSGFVIDGAVKAIVRSTQTVTERKLADLYTTESDLIKQGKRNNLIPKEITYIPLAGFLN